MREIRRGVLLVCLGSMAIPTLDDAARGDDEAAAQAPPGYASPREAFEARRKALARRDWRHGLRLADPGRPEPGGGKPRALLDLDGIDATGIAGRGQNSFRPAPARCGGGQAPLSHEEARVAKLRTSLSAYSSTKKSSSRPWRLGSPTRLRSTRR